MKVMNLHLATSKDKLRYSLNYIRFESMNTIIATDSHLLLYSDFATIFGINPQIVENEELIENVVNSGICIHRDEFKKIANKILVDYVEVDTERRELRFKDKKGTIYVLNYEDNERHSFPNWERVLRDWEDCEPIDGISFSQFVLESLLSVLKPLDINAIKMRFKAKNESIGLNIQTTDNREIKGMIMPRRWED